MIPTKLWHNASLRNNSKVKTMSSPKKFTHTVRVYIEDTDAAGIVYYPNHLKFFERGRTELLREYGFTKTTLEADYDLRFVIKSTSIEYKAPAFMDDLLEVRTVLEKHTPTRLIFNQEIYRSQILIASGKMTVVCVNNTYKPAPLPPVLLGKLIGL